MERENIMKGKEFICQCADCVYKPNKRLWIEDTDKASANYERKLRIASNDYCRPVGIYLVSLYNDKEEMFYDVKECTEHMTMDEVNKINKENYLKYKSKNK